MMLASAVVTLIAPSFRKKAIIKSSPAMKVKTATSRETGTLPFSMASLTRFSVACSVLLSRSGESAMRPAYSSDEFVVIVGRVQLDLATFRHFEGELGDR